MTAKEASLLQFLQVTQQFVIPIYQRTYSWTRAQCAQLWEDIWRAGGDSETNSHFVGSLVYIQNGAANVSAVPQRLLIDGQQRLTTISILLSELARALSQIDDAQAQEQHGIRARTITNYYLVNPEEDAVRRPKLVLTQTDKETLIRHLAQQEQLAGASRRIVENAEFFREKINNCLSDLGQIYHGLRKLMIVDVALERGKDNPQLIFESLNSTGLDLSKADLIRNYVLMDLEPAQQENLYNAHWRPMESAFGERYARFFDFFVRDFITVKNDGRIPNLANIYTEFKAHLANVTTSGARETAITEVLADLHHYANIYAKLNIDGVESDEAICAALNDLWTLNVDVANPFLMRVYDHFKEGKVSREGFVAVMRWVESYVFRRAICGVPTNSLNKTFANLHKEIVTEAGEETYLESLRAALSLMNSYRRFPDEDEFRRELSVKDVYNFRLRNYLLNKLENFGRAEKANLADYTIEHILPQNANLRPEWQADLGPNWRFLQTRYLHTLGNLTLTGYNSEYSDRPFEWKRNAMRDGAPIGFANSPLRLNTGLGQLEAWDEDTILQRAERLANECVQLWPSATLPAAVLEKYSAGKDEGEPSAYTLADHENLAGAVLQLFEVFRRHAIALDGAVSEKINKLYISYRTGDGTPFCDVVPQKNRLRLTLNVDIEDLDGADGLALDVRAKGHWGNGNVEVPLTDESQLDAVMHLVRQSFEDNNGQMESPTSFAKR